MENEKKKEKWCIRDNQLVSTIINCEANANLVILSSLVTIQLLRCPYRLHGMAWYGREAVSEEDVRERVLLSMAWHGSSVKKM